MIRIKVEYEAVIDDLDRDTVDRLYENASEFHGADRPFAALSEMHDNLMVEDRFDLHVSVAEIVCEACSLAATQLIHGSHLCDRCARESKRLEHER